MSLLDDFVRATKQAPCPICGRPDWCLLDKANPTDPARVVCKRVESPKRWGEAGYLHVRRKEWRRSHTRARTRRVTIGATPLFVREQEGLLAEISDQQLSELACDLHVSKESLRRLGIGMLSPNNAAEWGFRCGSGAWTFPMRNATGDIIGIRIRLKSRKKFAIPKSRNGLFIPDGMTEPIEQLLIAEGESDTAALLDPGYAVIGRPGCKNCTDEVVKYVRRHGVRDGVIVADQDAEGAEGAVDLAGRVRAYIRLVRIIRPPAGIKDARAWVIAGATRADVDEAIRMPWIMGAGSNRGTEDTP